MLHLELSVLALHKGGGIKRSS